MIKSGDFSGLASNYSKYRPDYSKSVLEAIKGPLIVCDSTILVQNVYLMWAKIYYDKMLCYKPRASIEDL